MMKRLVTALLFLSAVPFHPYWQDYELARRGVLACLVGLIYVAPGVLPNRVPRSVWPFNLLALWFFVRSLGVDNPGYAMEASCHMLALATLVVVGTGLSVRSVLLAAIPTGLAVAGCTIAQEFGLLLLADTSEMTSTLGNRNVASELMAVCGAAAAWLAADSDASRRTRQVAIVTLLLCGVAVALNGSRSGLIALPLGCLPGWFRTRSIPTFTALLLGLALGFGMELARGGAGTDDPAATASPSTIDVRLELWRGGMDMVAARPLTGHGSGQFQIEYARYRTEEEIELSSFNRQFLTSPTSAHNDYLQILIEGGLPAFLLCCACAFLALRRTPFSLWGPLLAFALLAGVRSPIKNAPTAALVFLYAGALLGRARGDSQKTSTLGPQLRLVKGLVFGGLLMWFGAAQLLSQFASAGYVYQMKTQSDFAALAASVDQTLLFRPYDHRFRLAQARLRLKEKATLGAARRDVEYLLHIAPADPGVMLAHAELFRMEGKPRDAMQILNQLREQDPHHIKATQWSAEILVELEQSPLAVVLLYRNNHPRLRKGLAGFLNRLAEFADKRQSDSDADLLLMEAAFIETLDLMREDPIGKPAERAWARFWNRLRPLDQKPRDMRPLVLAAVRFLALRQPEQAVVYAGTARGRRLTPLHLRMMDDLVAPLREFPAWRELLQ